jgi:hypothetical protein
MFLDIDGPLYIIHYKGMTSKLAEVLNIFNMLYNHQTFLFGFMKEILDIFLEASNDYILRFQLCYEVHCGSCSWPGHGTSIKVCASCLNAIIGSFLGNPLVGVALASGTLLVLLRSALSIGALN